MQSCGLSGAEVLALPTSQQASTHSGRMVEAIAAAASSHDGSSSAPYLVVLDASVAPEPGHSVAKVWGAAFG